MAVKRKKNGFVCQPVCLYGSMHALIRIRTYSIYSHIYVRTCVYVHVHTYIYICIYVFFKKLLYFSNSTLTSLYILRVKKRAIFQVYPAALWILPGFSRGPGAKLPTLHLGADLIQFTVE